MGEWRWAALTLDAFDSRVLLAITKAKEDSKLKMKSPEHSKQSFKKEEVFFVLTFLSSPLPNNITEKGRSFWTMQGFGSLVPLTYSPFFTHNA